MLKDISFHNNIFFFIFIKVSRIFCYFYLRGFLDYESYKHSSTVRESNPNLSNSCEHPWNQTHDLLNRCSRQLCLALQVQEKRPITEFSTQLIFKKTAISNCGRFMQSSCLLWIWQSPIIILLVADIWWEDHIFIQHYL